MTWKLLVWVVFIGVEVYRNWYIIEKKKQRPDYVWSFIFRGFFAILHGIWIDVQDLPDWCPVLTYQVTSFWLLFDVSLNRARRKQWFYTGENSGWIFDKLGKWPVVYLILKLVALGFMIWSITVLL